MAATTYAPSLGRIKATVTNFLSPETVRTLATARDLGELTKLLEGTWYGPSIVQALGLASGTEALEMGINRKFVEINRFAYSVAPFAGRPVLAAYLRRWDIENIGLILSAKAFGRQVRETDPFLVSERETPAGFAAGLLSLDELRQLLDLPSVDAVAQALVKYGYGTVLLPRLEQFQKTRNLFPLMQELEKYYYQEVRQATRFFQGDEWVVRNVLAGEIDRRNILAVLNSKVAGARPEEALDLLVEGGTLSPRALADLLNLPSVEEMVRALGPGLPLAEGLGRFQKEGTLVGFEVALRRQGAQEGWARLRQYPLSLGGIFGFLLRADVERADLRRILYGKVYGLPAESILEDLIVPRLS
jgi:V/A-type H+-transporting ATPase subunit C